MISSGRDRSRPVRFRNQIFCDWRIECDCQFIKPLYLGICEWVAIWPYQKNDLNGNVNFSTIIFEIKSIISYPKNLNHRIVITSKQKSISELVDYFLRSKKRYKQFKYKGLQLSKETNYKHLTIYLTRKKLVWSRTTILVGHYENTNLPHFEILNLYS